MFGGFALSISFYAEDKFWLQISDSVVKFYRLACSI